MVIQIKFASTKSNPRKGGCSYIVLRRVNVTEEQIGRRQAWRAFPGDVSKPVGLPAGSVRHSERGTEA